MESHGSQLCAFRLMMMIMMMMMMMMMMVMSTRLLIKWFLTKKRVFWVVVVVTGSLNKFKKQLTLDMTKYEDTSRLKPESLVIITSRVSDAHYLFYLYFPDETTPTQYKYSTIL